MNITDPIKTEPTGKLTLATSLVVASLLTCPYLQILRTLTCSAGTECLKIPLLRNPPLDLLATVPCTSNSMRDNSILIIITILGSPTSPRPCSSPTSSPVHSRNSLFNLRQCTRPLCLLPAAYPCPYHTNSSSSRGAMRIPLCSIPQILNRRAIKLI